MESEWAREQCKDLHLGDIRRTAAACRMLTAAVKNPAGTVTGVLKTPAERQAAYKFLESEHTSYEPLRRAFGLAAARQASGMPYVFVAVDGSSLSLTDGEKTKFGAIGSTAQKGRGMKVITSYAVDSEGVPVGILDQQWWARPARKKNSRVKHRKLADRETLHWCNSIDASKEVLATEAPDTLPWFIIDREGDGFHVLDHVREGCHFTIRANANRRVLTEGGARQYVWDVLAKQPLHSVQSIDLPATEKRSARRARLHVRIARVTLDMCDNWSNQRMLVPVSVVELREVYTVPRKGREKPVLWRLYTDREIKTAEDLQLVVNSYRTRWRIEELHKTWKTGACNIESSQLRSQKSLLLWATIMATVAARIERLKVLSRTKPDAPPDTEFSPYELKALVLLHNEHKKRTEPIARSVPTMEIAVRWIAELGGYTGKSSGGPPGAITIRRGLEWLALAAKIIEVIEMR